MYLISGFILNSGSISDLTVRPEFDGAGNPKPLILVGTNGSGKTGALSTIADALMEIAAHGFSDVLPQMGIGHSYYRLLGPATTKLTTPFSFCALKFQHGNDFIFFRSKSGDLVPATLQERMKEFPLIANWGTEDEKAVVGITPEAVEKIYRPGVYAFFPADRSEIPHWLVRHEDPTADQSSFAGLVKNQLHKPIVVKSTFSQIKPWLIDVVLDVTVDPTEILKSADLSQLKAGIVQKLSYGGAAILNINAILQAILGAPDVRIARVGRAARERKIMVVNESNQLVIPALDALSAGQAALFATFASIVRYADFAAQAPQANQIEGLVVIDDADAHLHADLQYEALPKLLKLFPRVQFILGSHAPLFLLGMKEQFGEDGFTVIELPRGEKITVERFTEFQASFDYFRATKAFEDGIKEQIAALEKPLVLLEGETDPKYLKMAARLLGFENLLQAADIDWVGAKSQGAAPPSGKDALNKVATALGCVPRLVKSKVVLLYDADAGKLDSDKGQVSTRSLPRDEANARCPDGIENLLPPALLEERFYATKELVKGSTITTVQSLRKTDFCDYVCSERQNPDDFQKFRPVLEMLQTLLGVPIALPPIAPPGDMVH